MSKQEQKSTELVAVENAVTSMNALTAGLAELASRFKGVIYDVTTPKGMAEAKAARKEIAIPRIEVEKIRKAAKAPILELGRKLDAEAARITRELEALEGPIDRQIKAEENRIEAERQAAIKKEQDRVDGIRARIEAMEAMVQKGVVARTSGEISELMDQVDAINVNESFAEFQDTADDTKAKVYEQLDKMHAAAIAREQEAERLAEERKAIEKLRAEQAERERVAREMEGIERARQAELQERLSELRGNQNLTATSGSELIAEHLHDHDKLPVDAAIFGDQVQQAIDAKAAGRARLEALLKAAREHEAEQERLAAERARQQEEQARLTREREELEARQRAEREAQEKREREERAAAAERERQAELERQRNYVPEAMEIVTVLMNHFQRDEDTVDGWLRAKWGKKQQKAA